MDDARKRLAELQVAEASIEDKAAQVPFEQCHFNEDSCHCSAVLDAVFGLLQLFEAKKAANELQTNGVSITPFNAIQRHFTPFYAI